MEPKLQIVQRYVPDRTPKLLLAHREVLRTQSCTQTVRTSHVATMRRLTVRIAARTTARLAEVPVLHSHVLADDCWRELLQPSAVRSN